MAKTQWILLFATFILSCISIAFIVTAFATTNWVDGTLKSINVDLPTSGSAGTVNYGLFKGSATLTLVGSQTTDLSMVCDYGENKCAYSCQTETEKQEEELKRLISGTSVSDLICPTSKSLSIGKHFNRTTGKVDTIGKASTNADSFINAGLYLTVVIFLVLTLIFSIASAIFSILNVVFNPVQRIFSIFGLYIWNGLAALFTVFVLVLYGVLFLISIVDNLAIRETLRQDNVFTSEGGASLGFSFWLLLIVPFLHKINMGLLFYRTLLINKEPPPPTIVVEQNDSTLMLY